MVGSECGYEVFSKFRDGVLVLSEALDVHGAFASCGGGFCYIDNRFLEGIISL